MAESASASARIDLSNPAADCGLSSCGTAGGTCDGGVWDGGDTESDGGSGSVACACPASQLGSCNPTPTWTGNSVGLGAYCSENDAELCLGQTLCDATAGGGNYCVLLGCTSSDDCGESACCVSVNGQNLCEPSGCGLCPDGG